jgi:hypothetical protein
VILGCDRQDSCASEQIAFAQMCINDHDTSNYGRHRQFAVSYQFWIMHSVWVDGTARQEEFIIF